MPSQTIFDKGPSNIKEINMQEKTVELDKHFREKRGTPLERAHETERNDLFPASLGWISEAIQSNQK